ncbi:MAG TPA: endopeptidase La, partial [Erysipelotrichaceae bacterium]|nr:endopeptidase La [Erysipelotrichaceae bacterium]
MNKENWTRVPVVCTRGIVVFPGQDVMIEVGRQKSINAVNEAAASYDSKVWIVCQNDIMVDNPTEANLYKVGTLSTIKIVRRKEGFMRVTFSGVQRATLKNLDDTSAIMMADVEPMEDVLGDPVEEEALVKQIISSFEKLSNLSASFPPEVVARLTKGVSAEMLTDQFAQYFPMSVPAKQKILETADVNERMILIITELEKQQRMAEIDSTINQKVKEHIDESQKEYFLREKIKTIQEELGDTAGNASDIEKMRQMIKDNPYPQHVKDRLTEELRRYEMLQPGSAEANVQYSYLDWMFKVPWYQETKDSEDLKKVRQILDEDHYGLEKVKDRIMEYLAVKQMTGSLSAPILCLVGPPGVGKTSLARSIARALDRKFVKMSLGGVRDEAEIRGHRRT